MCAARGIIFLTLAIHICKHFLPFFFEIIFQIDRNTIKRNFCSCPPNSIIQDIQPPTLGRYARHDSRKKPNFEKVFLPRTNVGNFCGLEGGRVVTYRLNPPRSRKLPFVCGAGSIQHKSFLTRQRKKEKREDFS